MSTINQQQTISLTTNKVSPVKSNIKKHRRIINSYLKCRFCEGTARIYLQDYRYMVQCTECQSEYYLKEQHK